MKQISFRTDILPLKDGLYRLALRLTMNKEEAEDIVQETLLKVWKRRERWQEIENIEGFAMTICHNLSLDHLRRMNNQLVSLEDNPMEHADKALSPFDNTMIHDRVATVREIINHLPEKQRACVQLRDIEGKAYKDIAAILNISEEQVKINIFRARQSIRQRFQTIENFKLSEKKKKD